MLARMLFATLLVATSSGALAQTIQLPSFNNVGVNTTVIVPDRGSAYLGGSRRAGSNWSSFGALPRTRGWGIRRQASGMSVSARIHDPRAADAALRRCRPTQRGSRRTATASDR